MLPLAADVQQLHESKQINRLSINFFPLPWLQSNFALNSLISFDPIPNFIISLIHTIYSKIGIFSLREMALNSVVAHLFALHSFCLSTFFNLKHKSSIIILHYVYTAVLGQDTHNQCLNLMKGIWHGSRYVRFAISFFLNFLFFANQKIFRNKKNRWNRIPVHVILFGIPNYSIFLQRGLFVCVDDSFRAHSFRSHTHYAFSASSLRLAEKRLDNMHYAILVPHILPACLLIMSISLYFC